MTDRFRAPAGVLVLMTLASSILFAAEDPGAGGTNDRREDWPFDRHGPAVEAGVKLTMGTDTAVFPHADAPKQLAFMVRYGMTPMHALQAATVNGADAIGLAGQIGTIAPGAYADIIAVPGDPLADISLLQNVGFVMKGGKLYKGP